MKSTEEHGQNDRVKRILITNYFHPANRGDAAIVEGLMAALRTQFADASFVVHSSHPDLIPYMHGVESGYDLCRWMPPPATRALGSYLSLWATARRRGITLPVPVSGLRDTLRDYVEADLIVAKHAALQGYYGDCEARLFSFWIAKLLRKPLFLCAQSIGPFDNPRTRSLAARVLPYADLISVRDDASLELLHDLGISGPEVRRTVDAAFAMPRKPAGYESLPRWEAPPEAHCEGESDRYLTLSVREWGRLSAEQADAYIESFAALVDWAAEEHSLNSLFLSTCTAAGGYRHDDRIMGSRIAQRCATKPRVVWGDYDPYELMNLFAARSMIHVGTRMHSNVLALLAGVPIVGIAYEPKVVGLAGALGVEDYVLDIKKISPETLIDRVQRALENRHQLAEHIAATLPEVRESAMDNARLIRDIHEAWKSGTP